MVLDIELEDRVYRDIESYCKANNLIVQKYIYNIITEKHSLNKYGDLNEIIPATIDKSTVEAKKWSRRTKKTDEVKVEEIITETKNVNTTELENENKEEMAEPKTEEKVVKPTVTRKRKLKTL